MAVTTTETINQSRVRCGRCGRLARGGVLIGDLAVCCVSPGDRKLLRSMIGDAPEEQEPESPGPQLSREYALSGGGGVLAKDGTGILHDSASVIGGQMAHGNLKLRTLLPNPKLDIPVDEFIGPQDRPSREPEPDPPMTSPVDGDGRVIVGGPPNGKASLPPGFGGTRIGQANAYRNRRRAGIPKTGN